MADKGRASHRRAQSVSPGGGGGFGSSGSCASSPARPITRMGSGTRRPSRRKSCRCGCGEGWDVGSSVLVAESLGRQAIGSDRRVAIERAKLGLAGAGDDFVDDLDPPRITVRQLRDCPIAAEHHAIEAEPLDDMGDIGLHLVASPRCVVRLRYYAGYLADDVRPAREFCDLALPGFP